MKFSPFSLSRVAWDLLISLAGVAALAGIFAVRSPHPVNAGPPSLPRHPSLYRPAGELALAEIRAQASVEKTPDQLSSWMDLALARYEQGPARYVEALVALEKARELGSLDDRLFFLSGVMYEAQGLAEYAAQDFERFLRHHPDDDDVRLRLANLFAKSNDPKKAMVHYAAVLARHPGDPVVSYNLALVCRDAKEWEQGLSALAVFSSTGTSLPENGWELKGDLAYGARDWTQAISAFRLALAARPDNTLARENLASALEAAGLREEAREEWKILLEKDPSHRKAARALRQSAPRKKK